jgi:hypothetical protein
MKNLTYAQAIAAVKVQGTTQTFARLPVSSPGWSDPAIYIGSPDGTNVLLYPAGTAYSPTASDQAATTWYDGPDKPPHG